VTRACPGILALIPAVLGFVACGGGEEVAPPPPAQPNRAPMVANGPLNQAFVTWHAISIDMSGGGAAFQDPDGDPLTYELQWFGRIPAGLAFAGPRVTGTTPDAGVFNLGVTVRDGRGGALAYGIFIDVVPNAAPAVASSNRLLLTGIGQHVNVDALQGGTTFGPDPQGDPVSYQVTTSARPQGLVISGTQVAGVMTGIGAVRIRVTATDTYGASSFDEFIIAVPGPEPASPRLPSASYVYEDARLALPTPFRTPPGATDTLGDTVPGRNPITDAGATLGRVLFYDRRLSVTNTQACGSCHEQAHGFAGTTRFSQGATGDLTRRNTMGLAEVRYNGRDHYFWDERARTLEALALMPIQDTTELANTMPNVVARLRATDFYPGLFQAAFGTPDIDSDRIARALAQFLRSLVSWQARVDRVENPLPGSAESVFSALEEQGRAIVQGQCAVCHQTTLRSLQVPMSNGLDSVVTDPGAGRGIFRAASLRNIARTAPYMHDGRFATLREVIDHYDHGIQDAPALPSELKEGGVPRRFNFSEADKVALEAFLNTFTDEEFLADPRFSDPFPQGA
jgi:cytochrome c peroxidase